MSTALASTSTYTVHEDDLDPERDNYVPCPCGAWWHPYLRAAVPVAVGVEAPRPYEGLYPPPYVETGVHAPIALHDDDGGEELLRSWACGDHTLTLAVPAYDHFDCLAGMTGPRWRLGDPIRTTTPVVCSKRHAHLYPPADRYRNPSLGQACHCCGHTGRHAVRRDRLASVPACIVAYETTFDREASHPDTYTIPRHQA